MKRSLAVLLVLSCFTMGGCKYSHEITDMAFAVALGFDKGDEGLSVSVQFARPLSISGGSGEESSGGGESSSEGEQAAKNKNTTLLTVKAEDFYTALSIAENSLSKQINLSHVKLVLFSEKLAQEGIGDYVTMLMKNSQFSPNTYAAISLCSAEEYMRTANPSLEVNPAKYYTLLFSRNDSNYMPSTSLRDLYFDLSAPGQEPVLPAANISDGKNDSQKSHEAAERGDYEAGEAEKQSENSTDVSGMAVIREGKLACVLSSREATAYHMLTGELKETYLTLPSVTQEDKHITLRLTQDKRPKKCVSELGESPYISAHLRLSGEIVECPDSDIFEIGIDGINEMASKEISSRLAEFLSLTNSFCRADVVGFGKLAKMRFSSYPEWVDYDWQKRYESARFDVSAQVNISREGLVHVG